MYVNGKRLEEIKCGITLVNDERWLSSVFGVDMVPCENKGNKIQIYNKNSGMNVELFMFFLP